ncbi:MAG: hypothetical protein WCK17_11390 [Verrucomicrobiota bacterium]
MSAQHLEVLDTTLQKTHQWLDAIAETAEIDTHTAYQALRAVLQPSETGSQWQRPHTSPHSSPYWCAASSTKATDRAKPQAPFHNASSC